MGRSVVIVGTQWGDEGKGKVVDLLTDRADAVIRGARVCADTKPGIESSRERTRRVGQPQ